MSYQKENIITVKREVWYQDDMLCIILIFTACAGLSRETHALKRVIDPGLHSEDRRDVPLLDLLGSRRCVCHSCYVRAEGFLPRIVRYNSLRHDFKLWQVFGRALSCAADAKLWFQDAGADGLPRSLNRGTSQVGFHK